MLMPERTAVEFQDLRARGGFEIAVFVENVVGGQQGFVKSRPDFAVFEQHGAVEERTAHFRRIGRGHAYQKRRGRRQFRGDLAQSFTTAADESLVHQKIAGEISHEREFGRDHQVDALILDLRGRRGRSAQRCRQYRQPWD